MRKAIRGYAGDKDSNLILIGTIPVPQSGAVRIKELWLDKERRSSKKKLFVSPLGRPRDLFLPTFWLREFQSHQLGMQSWRTKNL
jgi:hypothetical protein